MTVSEKSEGVPESFIAMRLSSVSIGSCSANRKNPIPRSPG